ncbi:fasciclin domain-containing protein [Flavobacterium cellulosilyticum]|uniref:Fasciclin domain-containing protein n=1 Tax=Flavobacterium cellulosilyticum TaxID=2541731 RepID=A0A4R5CAB8_9FLAO|nr:fasciclin domain-containing protein [Flavobacterium cellulosilyticum]TDD95739.1 fasciclin domain-containing protein [Flavobacterium cellulosilyticum]
MISLKSKYKKLFVGVLTIALVSCSNPWEDRQNNGDANLSVNLSEVITKKTEVSKFGALVVQTGYDKILSESKSYTVFAPTNEAMDQVDPAKLSTPEALSLFVANHIALTAYSSIRTQASIKIKMLSGKYLEFKGNTLISDATIVTADQYAKNGVYHIINKALTPKLNIWQYINSQVNSSLMSKYLISLKELNIYKADSIAKSTAIPGAMSDSLTNSYLRNVYNLNNEKNSYTLFLMENDGYTAEVDKLKPYLTTPKADFTTTLTSYFTIRDMAFPKAYLPNEIPSVLTSRFGVNVTIDKTQIIGEPIILSNGIIYRIKKVIVPLVDRLVTTKIEGEKNSSFLPTNLRSKIFYRDKQDPLGINYNDIMVQNPGVSLFTLNYNSGNLYSTTYKVYWRAINDVQTNVFQQRLRIGGVVQADGTIKDVIKLFDYTDVAVGVYNEVYLGDFTLEQAGNIDLISLIAANTTTNGNNSLTLDYLKFVPVIK